MSSLKFNYLLLLLLLMGCRENSANKRPGSGDIIKYELDIEKSLGKPVSMDLTDIGDEIEYIPLESGIESYIKSIWGISLSDSFIFVSDGDRLLQFSRYGVFIRMVGSQGRGPGEYLAVSGFNFNKEGNEILVLSPGKLTKFSTSGKFLSEFRIKFTCSQFLYLDNYFVFYPYRIPSSGDVLNSGLLFYSDSGRQFKRISSSIRESSIVIPRSCLHVFNSELYFMEYGSDTLYKIVDFDKEPHAIFSLGKYKMNSDLSADEVIGLKNKAWLHQIIETEKYLFLKVWWNLSDSLTNCIYDKSKSELYSLKETGLANKDLGGALFWPEAITDEGYLVDFIEVYKLKSLLRDSSKQVGSKSNSRIIDILTNLDETSNPVLIIIKPKN